jgi:hyaluronoglucosaminidase
MGTDWLGCIEGYYGTPLTHDARRELMSWMSTKSLDVFAYAPKDDPFHRHKWREPHPSESMNELGELIEYGKNCHVAFCYTISPGLDWNEGDEGVLIEKLRSLRALGCESMAILWDDVPPGGTELGETHGRAVARVVEAIDGVRWWTVGTDYAVGGPTPYLEALCKAVPDEVLVAWTGPYVVPLTISGAEASKLADVLGRKLLLWENFPVNDGPMSSVLHIGPYPERDAALVDASSGLLLNLMPQAKANRIGVTCGAAFWRDPNTDREAVWREALSELPGIEPLARASRSWVGSPGPDPELVGWMTAAPVDKRLRSYLEAGCRDGLDAELAEELAPWLDAWDTEAQAMLMCLDVLERGYRSGPRGIGGGVLWTNARRQEKQVFGIRNAVYPVMQQRGKETTAHPRATAVSENLTDMLARRAVRDE